MDHAETREKVRVEDILAAHTALKDIVRKTPLELDPILSEKYQCNVYLKREDLQRIRSFKIRGAYNKIYQLSKEQVKNGVICASAGNHAQGVAYTCKQLGIHAKIFMPSTTPNQKVSQVKFFGGSFVEVILVGDTFDFAFEKAMEHCEEHNMTFIHPFDNYDVITGQGTIAVEIIHEMDHVPDFVFGSIGGGGLIAGVSSYIKSIYPSTKVIGVEPKGASSMTQAFEQGHVVTLAEMDPFVDGAAVKRVGELTYQICRETLDDIVIVPEGRLCTTILNLYNKNAIVVEPAGALSVAALEHYRDQIVGKDVVCIISGGNNDIDRMQEIKERSLIFEGLKHYFVINFPQRSGALREFLEKVLGPNDDITKFEYTKTNNKESGPALVGIELTNKDDYEGLLKRMEENNIKYIKVNEEPQLFNLLV
ncbi:MAG: threonine ammonia-lyase IlvA [Bacillaceae bacterium]